MNSYLDFGGFKRFASINNSCDNKGAQMKTKSQTTQITLQQKFDMLQAVCITCALVKCLVRKGSG